MAADLGATHSPKIMVTSGSPPVSSAGRRCRTYAVPMVLVAVIAAFGLDIAGLATDLIRSRRLDSGGTPSTIGFDFADDLAQWANLALAATIGLAAVLFGLWFLCCYRRLRRVDLARWPSPWALLGWLIPVVNLAAPPAIMDELATPRGRGPDRSSPRLVGAWWFLWILGAAMEIGLRVVVYGPAQEFLEPIQVGEPTTQAQWTNWFALAIAADVILIMALICALVLVSRVRRAQDRLPI